MKKLKLEVDELAIETFETAETVEEQGTVRAHHHTLEDIDTCDGGNTCWDSCDGVCGTYFCTPDTCSLLCRWG